MHAIAGGRVRIYDFALGGETPRSLTLTDVDDADFTLLFRGASYFLRAQWPLGLTV